MRWCCSSPRQQPGPHHCQTAASSAPAFACYRQTPAFQHRPCVATLQSSAHLLRFVVVGPVQAPPPLSPLVLLPLLTPGPNTPAGATELRRRRNPKPSPPPPPAAAVLLAPLLSAAAPENRPAAAAAAANVGGGCSLPLLPPLLGPPGGQEAARGPGSLPLITDPAPLTLCKGSEKSLSAGELARLLLLGALAAARMASQLSRVGEGVRGLPRSAGQAPLGPAW
jgi:hypothetical protein